MQERVRFSDGGKAKLTDIGEEVEFVAKVDLLRCIHLGRFRSGNLMGGRGLSSSAMRYQL